MQDQAPMRRAPGLSGSLGRRIRAVMAILALLPLGAGVLPQTRVFSGTPWDTPGRRDPSGEGALGSVSQAASDAAAGIPVDAAYGNLPLYFEANQGQVAPRVKFLARSASPTFFLTSTGAEMAFTPHDPPAGGAFLPGHPQPHGRPPGTVLRFTLIGAAPAPLVSGREELAGKANYFIGADPARWRTNVPIFAKVHYRAVYPGIDVVFYGTQGHLEHDFIVAPGADPRAITIGVEGADRLSVDAAGNLVLKITGGEVRFQKPVVYQEVDGVRRELAGGYTLRSAHRIGFQVAAYDPRKRLVIDPVIFYAAGVGASGIHLGHAIAVDAAGNAYVAGATYAGDLPTTPGAFQVANTGGGDVFVTKLNPTGTRLIYSTYLGGSRNDSGQGIAVDAAGNAYVMGWTSSTDFPTTPGALQTIYGGGFYNAFVTKVNPAGTRLVYSTYLGGNGDDQGLGIAVDAAGSAYVTGYAFSTNFPTTSGAFQTAKPGSFQNAFVAKLNPTGSAPLVYSTYLGGSSIDIGQGIAVDAAGSAYVTGSTFSTNFPTTPGAFQTASKGGFHAFVTKLHPTGSAPVYSTYLGGSGIDIGQGIAVDAAGGAYVAGFTTSANFPTTPGAFQTAYGGGATDAFVTKLHPTGSALVYSTYLGGNRDDLGEGIAVDAAGNAYVTGFTTSTNFPTTPGAFQTAYGGGRADAFATKLNPTGSTPLVHSTYLGGSGDDYGAGIAADAAGNAYVTGLDTSTNFPTTQGAFRSAVQREPDHGTDTFVAKIVNVEADECPPGGPGECEEAKGDGTVNHHPGVDTDRVTRGRGGAFNFLVRRPSTTHRISGWLRYVNPATGASVQSVTLTSLEIRNPWAAFGGTCTNNGVPCHFTVGLMAPSSPTAPSLFFIAVSGGVEEGGTVRGGDIQVRDH